jgi:hypothetical protein
MINGDLKSLHLLWVNLACNRRYRLFVEEEDIKSFSIRADNEGLTFLTVTLPSIGKALDRFHATSAWIPPSGFSMKGTQTGVVDQHGQLIMYDIPLFLSKAIESALKGNSEAVDCVRQLSYVFYKLEVDHDEGTVESFLSQFIKTDGDLAHTFVDLPDSENYQRTLLKYMKDLIGRVLCNTDPFDIVPSHGGGATACRTPNWDKHHKFRYYAKLDASFPYSSHFFLSPTHLLDEYEKLEDSEVMISPLARVCLVPKDSRGPRIISCEPAELMYIQQGLMRKLYDVLETHELTAGFVNFTDQTINQKLAKLASQDGKLATLDLSDASDRVSLDLIRRVFPTNWVEALEACRSEETILPNSKVVKLNKFAPMGSSCCFPVEALVFWANVMASSRISTGRRYPCDVYVYGDDIIVDSNLFESAVRGLHSVGLKVNVEKSYFTGPFRESCGGDYHFGSDVTPVRVRKFLSKSRTSLVTNADLCNSLIAKFGYPSVASLISVIEMCGGYIYPRTELLLPATIRCSPGASNDVFFAKRSNKDLQREEYRILTVRSSSRAHHPPNWGELLRKVLSKARLSIKGPSQYEHASLQTDATLMPGWYTDSHSVVTSWVWTWLG